MDPQTNTASAGVGSDATGATTTFSEQVAAEKTILEESFDQHRLATSQHKRRITYYIVWAVLLLLLLMTVAGGSFILWRNRQGLFENLGIANLFNPTKVDIRIPKTTVSVDDGEGLLTVNGSQLITGDLTVEGVITGDGSGITNVQTVLPPFVAFTNKNNQLFFGNNQLFRNTVDSTTALQVQQANNNPVLSIDTVNNKVEVDNGLEVGNLADLHGGILTNPFFGEGGDIHKRLAIASEITNNQPGITYASTGNELLINPQNDPKANGNLFTTVYTATKVAPGNSSNFITIANGISSLLHAGSGDISQAAGNINIIGNEGAGNITIAANNINSTTLSGDGSILFSAGYFGLNPSISDTANGGILMNSSLTAGNCGIFDTIHSLFPELLAECVGSKNSSNIGQHIGLTVLNQDASSNTNINIYSEGGDSQNYLEGVTYMGMCAPTLISLIQNCNDTYSSNLGGPRLIVNAQSGGGFQSDATVQFYGVNTNDNVLTVRGASSQTGDLQQWQGDGGGVLSVITQDGSLGIGTANPTNKLSVVDSGSDTPANFTGTSGICSVDTFGGGWSCVSDQKLKENILQIDSASNIIEQLRGVTFAWKSDEEKNQVAGFVAQEVQKVLPGLVSELDDGTLSLNKDGLLPYLVEAVKESNGKVATINTMLIDRGVELDSLSVEFTKLVDRVAGVENRAEILEAKTADQDKRIRALEDKINLGTSPVAAP